MGNVRNHRNIKLVTTNFKRKLLVSKPTYHTCKRFSKDLMATELKRTKVYMNKLIYVGQAVLDISKTLMYTFYFDYLKPKYGDKVKLCYMDTDSFIFFFFMYILMIFTKILAVMLLNGLILLIIVKMMIDYLQD